MCKIADLVVLILLAACGVCDYKRKAMPLWLLVITSIVVIVLTMCCNTESMMSRAEGILIGVLFFIISKCTKESVGYGDSWLILLLGIKMGGLKSLQTLFIASLFAGVFSLFYMWRHHWKRTATIPFVPFLALSYLGVILA